MGGSILIVAAGVNLCEWRLHNRQVHFYMVLMVASFLGCVFCGACVWLREWKLWREAVNCEAMVCVVLGLPSVILALRRWRMGYRKQRNSKSKRGGQGNSKVSG